jgi:antitoxin component of RelBE/YafQ-DinJ toxin-antitoxin module
MGLPMSREAQIFLEECRQPTSVSPIETVISEKDYVDAVKAWKETTSTSPSGRHLGHYRTAILDNELSIFILRY